MHEKEDQVFKFLKLNQPAGIFYAITIDANTLIPVSESNTRDPYNNSTGIQRKLSESRVESIAKYSSSENAMFPTPIILSASSSNIKIDSENNLMEIKFGKMISEKEFFSIVDGQHRLAGIEKAKSEKNFELLALMIFDTTPEQDAEIFKAINRNQKPVTKSLVYDLFGLSSIRSVEKYLHEICVRINQDNRSVLKNHIKMLGYKTENLETPNVTQGALVDVMAPLFSRNFKNDNDRLSEGLSLNEDSDCGLREYLINDNVDDGANLVISYLNSWNLMVVILGYESSKLVKAVGYNLAFRLLDRFLKENDDFLNTGNIQSSNTFSKISSELENRKYGILSKFSMNQVSEGDDLVIFEKINRSSNKEKIFLFWILSKFVDSDRFTSQSVENLGSSLGDVKKLYDVIMNIRK